MEEFAAMVKDGMKDKGYSEFELADKAYLDVRTIRRYLNPNYNCYQVESLLAIAKALYSTTDCIRHFMVTVRQYPLSPKYDRAETLISQYPHVKLDKWNELLATWKEEYRIPRRYKSKIK